LIVFYSEILISYSEKYIWTYEIKEEHETEEKPTIVLVHGYGGSGMVLYFYKMY